MVTGGFDAGAGFLSVAAGAGSAAMSSMSWVKMAEALVAVSTAATWARFWAIFRTVLYWSATSGFSTMPRSCFSMAGSPSIHFAPQPPFF